MKFRKHFDYDVKKASDESAVGDFGPSMTVQSHAEDADINVLLSRYGMTGVMPASPRVPTYGDFTGISDYQSALNAVIDANEGFNELPANIRARFDNDPQRLLEFVTDDRNLEEARTLGLLKEVPDGQVTSSKVGSRVQVQDGGDPAETPGQGGAGVARGSKAGTLGTATG